MSRSRKSGGNSSANKVIWFVVVAGLIFSFFGIPYDPGAKGIQEIAISKSETVKGWVEGVAPAISDFIVGIIQGGSENPGLKPGTNPDTGGGNGGSDPGNGGSDPGTPGGVSDVQGALNNLPVGDGKKVAYNRDDWSHWKSVRPCWNVRNEVLFNEAEPGTVKLVDKDGKPVTDVNLACKVVGGSWVDPYTGKTFTNPKDLDTDHMIPLGYANDFGGAFWDKDRKADYANSLGYPNHLIAVSASANRSKGDKGPSEWKPSEKSYWCTYATDWVNISVTWQLSVSEADKKALGEMLGTCS